MLEIPEVGFQESRTKPRVRIDALADWLEANILFEQPEMAKADVVDMLLEYQVCPDECQDLAHQIADSGWDELRRRQRWGGLPSSVRITQMRVETPALAWQASPIWAFFVLLSTLRLFPDWAQRYREYSVQGDLFERVVEAIVPGIFPGWMSYRSGWAPDNTKNIRSIVNELCGRLYVSGAPDLDDWISDSEKDGGLDIVCYRSFEDEREALPVVFFQCASGTRWREKVHTPSATFWQKCMNSAIVPTTGIVAPFVVETKELKRAALDAQVVVLDRLRMLSTVRTAGICLTEGLLSEMFAWMEPRIAGLPRVA